MKTIDVAKFGSGNVFHVLAQEHKRGTLVDGREDHDAIALCGKTGTKSRVERRLDARAIAHDGVAICGNCRPYIAFSEIDPEGDTHKSAEKTAGKGADSMPRKTKDATIASTTKGRARAAAKKSGAKPRKPLDESGERKVLRLAKKLAKDGVDETGATIYGRKLLKLKSGLRTSLPPIPSSLDRADAEKVEKGIGVERARREKVEA